MNICNISRWDYLCSTVQLVLSIIRASKRRQEELTRRNSFLITHNLVRYEHWLLNLCVCFYYRCKISLLFLTSWLSDQLSRMPFIIKSASLPFRNNNIITISTLDLWLYWLGPSSHMSRPSNWRHLTAITWTIRRWIILCTEVRKATVAGHKYLWKDNGDASVIIIWFYLIVKIIFNTNFNKHLSHIICWWKIFCPVTFNFLKTLSQIKRSMLLKYIEGDHGQLFTICCVQYV